MRLGDSFLTILDKTLTPIRERESQIHAGVANVIDKDIQREPQDRFATALEFREALKKFFPPSEKA